MKVRRYRGSEVSRLVSKTLGGLRGALPKHIFRFMGFSLVEAWMLMLFSSILYFPSPNSAIPIPLAHAVGSVASVIIAIATFLAITRIVPLSLRRIPLFIMGIIGTAGGLLILLANQNLIPQPFLILGFIFGSAYLTTTTLAWQEYFATQGVRAALLTYGLSTLLGTIVYLLVVFLSGPAAVVISLLLPTAGSLALRPSPDTDFSLIAQHSAKPKETNRKVLGDILSDVSPRLMVVCALVGFSYGAIRTMGVPADPLSVASQIWIRSAGGLSIAMIVACVLAFFLEKDAALIALRIALPCSAMGAFCFILPISVNVELSLLLVSIGYSITNIMVWALLIDLYFSKRKPVAGLFCYLWAVLFLGTLVGQLSALIPGVNATVLAFICCLAILIAALMLPGMGKTLSITSAHIGIPAVDVLTVKVNHVADRYHLSSRERDVLNLWATGHNSAYVEEELNISKNTVKTHLNHIYAKTGTESREELLDLLDDKREES